MEEPIESLTDTTQSVPILEETYPVSPPFSYILIQTDPVSKRTQYMVVEIPLDSKEQAIYKKILNIMIEELDVDFSVLKDTTKAEEFLKKKVVDIVKRYRISLNESQFEKIMYYLTRDLIGYGKIQPMMLDHNIEDISCDGVGIPIYVWHRKYESIASNISFDTAEELDSFIIKLAQRANRHISIANPLLDASLPDGSRIQLTYGKEVTQRGSTFTIRKFKADPFTITDLILYNTIDLDIAAFYWFIMEHNISILIAGGTAAGKTTLLNTIAMMIKPDMKIVTIEDSVTGDSETVVKHNGIIRRTTIGELVDYMIENYESEIAISGHEVCRNNPENIEILTMTKNGKIRFSPIKSFIRHKVRKPIYEIVTSTGRRIKVTGDHSLFTLNENSEIVEVLTRDLRIGDKIATPRTYEYSTKEREKIDLLEHLDKLNNVYIKGEPVKTILEKYKQILITKLKLNENTWKWRYKQKIISAKHLYELIKYFGLIISPNEMENIFVKNAKSEYELPLKIKITDKLLTYIGLWLADGCYDKTSILLTNTDTICREIIYDVAKQFNMKVAQHSDGATLIYHSALLKQIFEEVFELKGKAETKRVPSWIFNLSERQIALVLKGLFSGEGTVNSYEISLSSQSLGLLKDIQHLLLRLSIISHISKSRYSRDSTYKLRISNHSNINTFKEKVGFLHQHKIKKLEVLTQKRNASHTINETIPLPPKAISILKKLDTEKAFHSSSYKNSGSSMGYNYLNKILDKYERFQVADVSTNTTLEQLKMLAESDILWDSIVKIEEIEMDELFVYDLSVPETENFVCENIIVHNTAELNLAHENWIPSVVRSGFGETTETGFRRGQISMYELLRAAMRQRPDYIIVGEIRGEEAYAMFQAMSTGHRGLGTIHGDSVEGVIHRLESKPMNIPRSMMKSLDIIHVVRKVRLKSKFARRTQTITELIGLDPVTEEILTNKLFQWNPRDDDYIYFGRSYVLEKIMENTGLTDKQIEEELERRKTVLRWMVKKKIRYFEDVASIIQEYYSDPDRTIEKARRGLKT